METEKKRSAIPGIGMILVCVMAIAVSVSSIFTTYRMQEMASKIYEHPYTVSNESRAMRSRLLDMRFFILNIFARQDQDEAEIRQIVEERYGLQHDAIEVIESQYLGPQEDIVRLKEAVGDLERTQNDALPIILPMEEQATLRYIEDNLYPKYDAVSDALDIIIRFADQKVQSLETESRAMSVKATVSSIILTLFLPAYFLIAFWRERKNIREIRYREQLFDILSTNVDEVFAIFNLKQDNLEYVSANCQRVLDIKADEFTNDLEALRRQIPDEERGKFDEFMQKKRFAGEKEIDLPMRFSSGEPRWIRLQLFPGVVHGKVNRYILTISDQSEDMRIRQTLRDALVNAQNANAAKQEFLSRMSHEIRTPMNAIVGMTAIAATYIEDRKRVESCLEKIYSICPRSMRGR